MDFDRSFAQLLSSEESAQIDSARLTAKQKFSARVSVYALRLLKQIATTQEIPLHEVSHAVVSDWLAAHPIANHTLTDNDLGLDDSFKEFWSKIVLSAFRPLNEAAELATVPVEQLTLAQIIAYFEQVARVELGLDKAD
ncbi:MAG: hypothetical protein AAGF24_04175 [Cyanobacteria bacterium P01_H01_bin.121]